MKIFWRILIVFIFALVLSNVEFSVSIYKLKDNWLVINFPVGMDKPILKIEVGTEADSMMTYLSPFSSERDDKYSPEFEEEQHDAVYDPEFDGQSGGKEGMRKGYYQELNEMNKK